MVDEDPTVRAAMLVTISIGNSHTAFAVHGGREAEHRAAFRLRTDPRRTADEIGLWVTDLLGRAQVMAGEVDAVCLCSVVPSATAAIVAVCERTFGVRPLVVRPGVRTGLPVRYRPEATLGTDRLVDAAAAHDAYGAPVIAVDFGTATTINAVDAAGVFVGGAIAPGIGIAAEALAQAGARLALVDVQATALPLVGRTTESAVQSGVVHGHAALVDGLIARMTKALGGTDSPETVPVVATGGWAGVIAPLVPRIGHVRVGLIHDGLRLVWERNAPVGGAA